MNDDIKTPEAAPMQPQPEAMPPMSAPAAPTPETPMPPMPTMAMPGGASHVFVANHGIPKQKWYKKRAPRIAGLVAAVVLLGAAGWFFGIYWPNTPENVYRAGLANSAKAQDTLVNYASSNNANNYKSVGFDGTVKVKSPSMSFDLAATGAYDNDANATANVNLDVLGRKMTTDILSIKKAGDTSPDVYVKVGGVKSLLEAQGMTSLSKLDGKWISIDHTLIDTYAAALERSSGTDLTGKDKVPTNEQLIDATKKVAAVNKMYLYTTDKKTAVLKDARFIGQEKVDGRTQNHYSVGYDKDHLKAYVDAVSAALDSSSLNTWSKKVNDGKSLSKLLDLDSLKSDISSFKTDYTFDLWVDTGTKMISKLAFTNPSDSSSMFTVSQNYTGGSSYPFMMTIKDKDENGNPETGTFNMTVDTKTQKVSFAFTVATQDSEGTMTVNGSFTLTPSSNTLKVAAPKGATSIVDILNELGLGSLTTEPPISAFSN